MPFSKSLSALLLAFALAAALALPTRATTPTWSGVWRFKSYAKIAGPFYGGNTLTLVQKGSTVTGSFGFFLSSDQGTVGRLCYTGKGGTVTGSARGRTLKATMIWPARGGHPRAKAPFTATMSRNGRTFEMRGEVTTGECGRSGVYLVLDAERRV